MMLPYKAYFCTCIKVPIVRPTLMNAPAPRVRMMAPVWTASMVTSAVAKMVSLVRGKIRCGNTYVKSAKSAFVISRSNIN